MPRRCADNIFPTGAVKAATGWWATPPTHRGTASMSACAGLSRARVQPANGPIMLRRRLCCGPALGGGVAGDRQLLRNITSAHRGGSRDAPRRFRAGAAAGAPLRSRDRGGKPSRRGPAGCGDVPHPASPLVRDRVTLRRSDPPHPDRLRSGERRPDHPGHQVLQEPPGPGRTPACRGAGQLRVPAPASRMCERPERVALGEPGRDAARQQHRAGRVRHAAAGRRGLPRGGRPDDPACTTSGTASRSIA